MMVSFSNNDIDALIFFYKGLENKIKEISCYYGIYGEDGYFNYVNNKASIVINKIVPVPRSGCSIISPKNIRVIKIIGITPLIYLFI